MKANWHLLHRYSPVISKDAWVKPSSPSQLGCEGCEGFYQVEMKEGYSRQRLQHKQGHWVIDVYSGNECVYIVFNTLGKQACRWGRCKEWSWTGRWNKARRSPGGLSQNLELHQAGDGSAILIRPIWWQSGAWIGGQGWRQETSLLQWSRPEGIDWANAVIFHHITQTSSCLWALNFKLLLFWILLWFASLSI